MTTAGRPKDPEAAADCFASVLDAEAQAREAIRRCHEQHGESVRQAQAQAVRIRQRASGRVEKIQAAAAARVKALRETAAPSAPAGGKSIPAVQDARLQAAVGRLAAQLTGGGE
jgi:hypothetical protein